MSRPVLSLVLRPQSYSYSSKISSNDVNMSVNTDILIWKEFEKFQICFFYNPQNLSSDLKNKLHQNAITEKLNFFQHSTSYVILLLRLKIQISMYIVYNHLPSVYFRLWLGDSFWRPAEWSTDLRCKNDHIMPRWKFLKFKFQWIFGFGYYFGVNFSDFTKNLNVNFPKQNLCRIMFPSVLAMFVYTVKCKDWRGH